MTLAVPTIYNLANDYADFGLTQSQASVILSHRFNGRYDPISGVTGKPACIVLHIQDGETRGSLDYWTTVQASSTMMANRDGSLLKIIPENHGPWTNGDVMNPKESSAFIRNKGGNPNVWSLTLEAAGHPFQTMEPAMLNSIAWQCIEWMKTYELTIDEILPHNSINSVTRANCGLYVPMIKSIILREMGAPIPKPDPEYPEPDAWEFDIHTATGWKVHKGTDVFMCRFTDLCVKDAIPRVRADSKSPQSDDKIKVNTDAEFLGWFIGGDKNGWRILPDGSRVRASSFYTDLKAKKR